MSILDSIREFVMGFLPEDLQDEAGGYMDEAEQTAQDRASTAEDELLG